MASNNAFNYANLVATSTHMPGPKEPFSRGYTNPEGYLDVLRSDLATDRLS